MESFRSSSRPPKCTSHLGIGLGEAARLLDKEYGDPLTLLTKFGLAETFQYNATADILKDFEIEPCRESVVSLIDYLLQQAEPLTGQG